MVDLVPADQFARLPERFQRRAREIAHRVGEIDALCLPTKVEAIGDALKLMRQHFRPQPDTEPAEMAAGFKASCRDLPEWAISEAANDYLAGRVPNHTGQFMPTCAEFAKRAREILLPFLAERASLRVEAEKLFERATDEARRLAIELERRDPAIRRRVAAMFEQATAGQYSGPLLSRSKLTEEKRAALDAYRVQRPFTSKIGHSKQQSE